MVLFVRIIIKRFIVLIKTRTISSDRGYHVKTKIKRMEIVKIMNRVAQFEKVSFNQFLSDFIDTFEEFDYSKPRINQFC